MEELQSTEVLEREILEDARKKAYRILKTADEAVAAGASEWEKKTASGLEDLRKQYREKTAMAEQEITARLPIDMRRAKAQYIDRLLVTSVEGWFSGLERNKILSILKNELALRLSVCAEFSSGNSRAQYYKLTQKEAQEVLSSVMPKADFSIVETAVGGRFPAIMLESGNVRITVSVDSAVEHFLGIKRFELTQALLGDLVLTGVLEQNSGGGQP